MERLLGLAACASLAAITPAAARPPAHPPAPKDVRPVIQLSEIPARISEAERYAPVRPDEMFSAKPVRSGVVAGFAIGDNAQIGLGFVRAQAKSRAFPGGEILGGPRPRSRKPGVSFSLRF